MKKKCPKCGKNMIYLVPCPECNRNFPIWICYNSKEHEDEEIYFEKILTGENFY